MDTDKTIYQFAVKTPEGKEISLSDFKNKVIMIVNTATACGETPQLKVLEAVYQKYKTDGFIILGFPSNQFKQEPLNNKEISSYCKTNYGVTFPVFQKIDVRGKNAHPLFTFLGSKKLNGKFSAKPWWNFYKYIIDKNGKVKDYFFYRTYPDKKRVIKKIEAALANN